MNGKEYKYKYKIEFEGQYLDEKRWNGKIKEYNRYGQLIFEGDYSNGEKNGKGKEYNIYDELIFEGEYYNGKRWNGKEKHIIYGFIFEGDYLNGKRWTEKGCNKNGNIEFEIKRGAGKGREYYNNDKLKFEGEYLNGERNGKGREYNNNGDIIFPFLSYPFPFHFLSYLYSPSNINLPL